MSISVVCKLHESQHHFQGSIWKLTPSSTPGVLDSLLASKRSLRSYHGIYEWACVFQKKYDFDTDILDAFWCYFTLSKDDTSSTSLKNGEEMVSKKKCLCVREKALLTFIMPGGQIHHLPLPFLVKGVWPLSEGLLIERRFSDIGNHEDGNHGDGLSILFSLLHPLNELCPLSCRKNDSLVSYFTDPSEHVVAVWISDKFSILVLFNGSMNSIYEIRPAKETDIPSPVPSTPSRSNTSSFLCTPKPLSSSAPARYAHISPGTLLKFSLKVEPSPKQHIGSSNRKAQHYSPDVIKPWALQRVKKDTPIFGSGRRSTPRVTSSTVDNVSMKSSGRSPFIDRYRTPLESLKPTAAWKMSGKPAESPSNSGRYHGSGRISPYSVVLDTQLWSKFYSEAADSGEAEEMQPKHCLHLMWTEEDKATQCANSVSDVLIVKDCTDQEYITPLVKPLNRLYFLSLSRDESHCSVGQSVVAVIEGVKSALYLESIQMLLVLMVDSSLVLYNGTDKVCNVDVGAVFDTGTGTSPAGSICSIGNNIEDEFTLVTSDGHIHLCSINNPIEHQIVDLSVKALSTILCDKSMKKLLLSSVYHVFVDTVPNDQWQLFCRWILTSLDVPDQYFNSLLTLTVTSTDPDLIDAPLYNLLATSMSIPCTESDTPTAPPISTPSMTLPLSHCVYSVLSILHLLYEELKLNIHFHHYLKDIGILLYTIARYHGWNTYIHHYTVDHPILLNHTLTDSMITGEWTDSHSSMNENESPYCRNEPPGIYQWIHSILNNDKVEPYPVLCGTCNVTEKIVKVYSHLVTRCYDVDCESLYETIGLSMCTSNNDMEISVSPSSLNAATPLHNEIVDLLSSQGMSSSVISSLPVGVCVPLRYLLLQCRSAPSFNWSQDVYNMIGRTDVHRTLHGSKSLSEFLKLEVVNDESNGMDINEEIYKLKFPSDSRIREVKRLLQSSEPVRIAIVQNPEMSDHEFVDMQKSQLLKMCQRTMSLSIGRGMFTMATAKPMLFSAMKIPKLNLSGQAPPRNSPVSLEPSDYPNDMTVWPDFHNGVSTALKLDSGVENIDSTWIILNQPSEGKDLNSYAGFLMGLGLNGHLGNLNPYNMYDYLQQKHEVMVIGLLLGISAAKCGSVDLSVASILSVFLPPLLPKGSVDLETSVLMQSAAMFSLGLVYMNSCNRFIAETLLKQIGHSPGPELEFAQNRECYSLSAGLALGMVAIGDGVNNVGLSDLHIEDQLFLYINGGKKQSLYTRDLKAPSLLVMEGDQINTHVTAPGAILALGLLYLKTNNSSVAGRLTPPTTHYQLESIRSDFLMLRVLCYGLIMWNSVSPTREWVYSLIPEIVNTYAFEAATSVNDDDSNDIDYQTMCQCKLYIIAGACLALGFRYAGTYRQDAYQCLLNIHSELIKYRNLDYIGKTCIESFICAIMLALSMVNSGSGDIETLRLVRQYHVKVNDFSYGKHMAIHMALGLLLLGGGRYCLSRSNKAIAVLLSSIYPHFPSVTTDNRYHLQALRHFYVLACEPRVLVTREIDSGQPCIVPITISMEGCRNVDAVTPCVIPEDTTKISIISDQRYLPVKYDMRDEVVRNAIKKSGYVFVKRHVAYASYTNDPQGEISRLSLASTSVQHQFGSVCQYTLPGIRQLFKSRHLQNVLSHLYHTKETLYTTLLINCVSNDQMDLYHLLMELSECLLDSSVIDNFGFKLWNLKLCQAFLKAASKRSSLISGTNKGLITSLDQYVEHVHTKFNLRKDSNSGHKADVNQLSLAYLLKNKLPKSVMTHRVARDMAIKLQTMAFLSIPQQVQVDHLFNKMYEDKVSPSQAAKTIMALSLQKTPIS